MFYAREHDLGSRTDLVADAHYSPGCGAKANTEAVPERVNRVGLAVTTATSGLPLPAQPVDATQALNLSAGVSNCKVSRGRSFS